MKGRRILVPASNDINDVIWEMQPGDYCGPVTGYAGKGTPSVFFLLPPARDEGANRCVRGIHHVNSPPHTFRECADGSLEIRNSIGAICRCDPKQEGFAWHGYLDEGHIWREC